MSKRLLFLLLPLLLAVSQPAPAFWGGAVSSFKSGFTGEKKRDRGHKKEGKSEPSAWDKLVADANKTMGTDHKDKKDKKDKEGKDGKEPSAWDKLVSDSDKELKESEKDQGNKDNPSWDELKNRASSAMEQFAKDGKGFDIMRKVKRKVEKLAADENSALTGRFYDLKQPIDKRAKPLHREQVVQFIKNYMDSDWDPEMLEQYYSPKVELAAPYFYLPRCKASYAPLAFKCNSPEQERRVEPQDWLVVYSGEVTAPKTGHFRFVGMGDDAIVVRFDEKVVLESGWSIPSKGDMVLGTKRQYQEYISSPKGGCALYQYKETPHWNQQLGGIQTGPKFHVKEGKTYPIQIILSEIPGSEFGFCLLIEELANGNAPTGQYKPGDAPTVAIFRTNETLPDLKEIEEELKKDGQNYAVGNPLEVPPFLEDSPIWKVKSNARRRSIVERVVTSTVSDEDTAMGRRKDAEEEEEKEVDAEEEEGEEGEDEAEGEESSEEEADKDNLRRHHHKRHHHKHHHHHGRK